MRFRNREQAGEELAEAVAAALGDDGEERVGRDRDAGAPAAKGGDVMVLALPRGGVPVAAPVARRLNAPLDVSLVRKLGVPGNPDLAMGAVAGGGVRVLNEGLIRELRVPEDWLRDETRNQMQELERRARRYRQDAEAEPVEGRTVVLVDDGIATGATVRAAVRAVREQGARRVVVATPTAATESVRMLKGEVEQVVCLHTPEPFRAVALWYEAFPQVEDEEVVRILAEARRERGGGGGPPPAS